MKKLCSDISIPAAIFFIDIKVWIQCLFNGIVFFYVE